MREQANNAVVISNNFYGQEVSFESGWIAKQADGAVIARAGDTVVMVTVCEDKAREGASFFPMVVEYQEKMYAGGMIPGGYFKREAKPGEHEILNARLIDRPIRPMFPQGYKNEVQIICNVLSFDAVNNPDTLAISAASAALITSPLPFTTPIAAVRVGRINGKLLINPTLNKSDFLELEMIVAGTKESIVMVEGGAKFIPEEEVLEALLFAHQELAKIINMQEELQAKIGAEKVEFTLEEDDDALVEKVKSLSLDSLCETLKVIEKHKRKEALSQIQESIAEQLSEEFPESEEKISNIICELIKKLSRSRIIDEGVRLDGRGLKDVRPIECEVSVLPRTHGSALFTRGETQAIVTTTLGTSADGQRIEKLEGTEDRKFMLHYNFPPFCTGEVKPMRGTSRREIGHGNLVLRALKPVIPIENDYPYVIRVVSEITESNGSSSMASVCGGSLSLMDAGVEIKKPVSGVAMGLIKEGDEIAILTDILGDEDHFGDMDFKVCGSAEGITALQMDIKCSGLSKEILQQALNQAKEGRLHILSEMAKTIEKPREEVSNWAPIIEVIYINPDKIRDVIGAGGKVIKSIVERTGAKIDIQDSGKVSIACTNRASGQEAKEIILGLVEEAEIGKIYEGLVKRTTDFGAFVEILPGIEGLVHISQLEEGHVKHVEDVVREGEMVNVKVIEIDRQGRVRLSRKEALAQ